MIVDTSAVFAIVAPEPDCGVYESRLVSGKNLAISALTVLESRIVLHSRLGAAAVAEFDTILAQGEVEIIPFEGEQIEIAFEAFKRYGKGQGHPAQLNIMDCAAYALAKQPGEPLLYKGNDFLQTDIQAAI